MHEIAFVCLSGCPPRGNISDCYTDVTYAKAVSNQVQIQNRTIVLNSPHLRISVALGLVASIMIVPLTVLATANEVSFDGTLGTSTYTRME